MSLIRVHKYPRLMGKENTHVLNVADHVVKVWPREDKYDWVLLDPGDEAIYQGRIAIDTDCDDTYMVFEYKEQD